MNFYHDIKDIFSNFGGGNRNSQTITEPQNNKNLVTSASQPSKIEYIPFSDKVKSINEEDGLDDIIRNSIVKF